MHITETEKLSFQEIIENYTVSEHIDQVFLVDKNFGLQETAEKLFDPEVITDSLLASKIIQWLIPDSHVKFVTDSHRSFATPFSKIDLSKTFEVITAPPIFLIKEV